MPEFAPWESFYVIVGSAAGALIGLQFVVLTLMSGAASSRRTAASGAAYLTPTIIYFSGALLLSAVMRVPWPTLGCSAAALAIIGGFGIFYCMTVTRRIHEIQKRGLYQMVLEDRLFYIIFPNSAFVILALSALFMPFHLREALFGIGATVLVLLFAGIHNAWDIVTFHTLGQNEPDKEPI